MPTNPTPPERPAHPRTDRLIQRLGPMLGGAVSGLVRGLVDHT